MRSTRLNERAESEQVVRRKRRVDMLTVGLVRMSHPSARVFISFPREKSFRCGGNSGPGAPYPASVSSYMYAGDVDRVLAPRLLLDLGS